MDYKLKIVYITLWQIFFYIPLNDAPRRVAIVKKLLPASSKKLVSFACLWNLTHLLVSLFKNRNLMLLEYKIPYVFFCHFSFCIPKLWQILKRFGERFHQAYNSLISEEWWGWWPWVIDKEVLDQMHIKNIVNLFWKKRFQML